MKKQEVRNKRYPSAAGKVKSKQEKEKSEKLSEETGT